MSKKTVLFLAANPGSTSRLALDQEAREIEAKIRASEYRDVLALQTRWAVRPDDLLQALLEDRPTIVHFSGHGSGVDGLVLEGESGQASMVSADALKHLFTTLKDDIRVVVLNACYSEEQAKAIAEVIDCVIGMKQSVGDRAAAVFAASFYRGLGFGRSVKNAFEQGLTAVALSGLAEPIVPAILQNAGVNAAEVFVAGAEVPQANAGAAGTRPGCDQSGAVQESSAILPAEPPARFQHWKQRRMNLPTIAAMLLTALLLLIGTGHFVAAFTSFRALLLSTTTLEEPPPAVIPTSPPTRTTDSDQTTGQLAITNRATPEQPLDDLVDTASIRAPPRVAVRFYFHAVQDEANKEAVGDAEICLDSDDGSATVVAERQAVTEFQENLSPGEYLVKYRCSGTSDWRQESVTITTQKRLIVLPLFLKCAE